MLKEQTYEKFTNLPVVACKEFLNVQVRSYRTWVLLHLRLNAPLQFLHYPTETRSIVSRVLWNEVLAISTTLVQIWDCIPVLLLSIYLIFYVNTLR